MSDAHKLIVPNYWETDIYKKHAEINIKDVKNTIHDLKFTEPKIMVCGRALDTHPDFYPRFSTPTTNIDSTLYVTVDHHTTYQNYITRKGNYAISLIVDPVVPKKISSIGGNIYWFSPEYFDYDVPKINFGKNSGLAAIALASYFGAKYILISGIHLTGHYSQYIDGASVVFDQVRQRGTKIFSLDGDLAERLTYDEWCNL